mgnify:CR=1 FL=1
MEKLEFPVVGSGNEIDIRLRAANNSSGEEWAIDLIELSEGSTLHISEVKIDDKFKVYETSVTGIFQIKTSNALNIKSIEVYDLLGKLNKSVQIKDQLTDFKIDLSSLKSSIYILRIHTNKGVLNKKIIKNN